MTSHAGVQGVQNPPSTIYLYMSACLGFAELRAAGLKKKFSATGQRRKHIKNGFLSTSVTTKFCALLLMKYTSHQQCRLQPWSYCSSPGRKDKEVVFLSDSPKSKQEKFAVCSHQ